jgi:tape measure domain-containing protein
LSLDLGTLSLKIGVDHSGLGPGLAAARRRVNDFARGAGGDATRSGESIGQRLGQGVTSGAHRGMVGLGGALATGGRVLTRFGGLGVATLGGLAAAAGGMGIKVAAGNEQAKISFTTMLGSAQKAGDFLGKLQKFAAATPFEFPELQTAASSLLSVGIKADQVIPIMTSLGNATSGMGTGAEGVQRATVALQQMNAAGRITAEDLNQLRDAGIPVYDLLTKATGKSTAEIAKMAQTGKLGRKELDQMMAALASGKGLERFNGLMQKQSQSLVGMFSTLKDTLGQGLSNAITPLIPLIKSGLTGASNTAMAALKLLPGVLTAIVNGGTTVAHWLRGLFDYLRGVNLGPVVAGLMPIGTVLRGMLPQLRALLPQFMDLARTLGVSLLHTLPVVGAAFASIGRTLGGILAAALPPVLSAFISLGHVVPPLIDFIVRHQTAFGAFAIGILAVVGAMRAWRLAQEAVRIATVAYTAVQAALNVVMSANPIALVVLALVGLVAGLIYAYKHSEKFRDVVRAVFSWFKTYVPLALHVALAAVTAVWRDITGAFSAAWTWVSKTFSRMWAAADYIIHHPIDAAKTAIAKILGATGLRKVFNDVSTWVSKTFSKTWAAADYILHHPIDAAKTAISKILGVLGLRKVLNDAWTWVNKTFSRAWAGADYVLHHPVDAARMAISKTLGALGLRKVFNDAWTWVKKTFARAWAGADYIIHHPIDAAKTAIARILGRTGLQDVFTKAVRAVGRIWGGLQALAKKPISFIINTVLNGGLIKAYNWLAGVLPGIGRISPIRLRGFRHGGSTGVGGDSDIAGFAHANEHYATADEVRRTPGGHSTWARMRGLIRQGITDWLPGYAAGGRVWPTNTHRLSGNYAGHSGVDIAAGMGAPIYAAEPGRISYTGWGRGFGQAIFEWLRGGLSAVYGHTSQLLTRAGVAVSAGQLIGRVGATGHATGPHLHFEINSPGPFGNPADRANTLNFLRGADVSGGGGGGGLLGSIVDYVGQLRNRIAGPLNQLKGLGSSPWARLAAAVPRALASRMIEAAKSAVTHLFGTADPSKGFGTKGSNQQRGHSLMLQYGFPESDWPALQALWQGESGWNERAQNPSSGAYGIPQALPGNKMASVGADWRGNPNTQIMWGLKYIKSVYGNPTNTYRTWLGRHPHWYGDGTMSAAAGFNWFGDKGAELVLNPQLRRASGGETVLDANQTSNVLGGLGGRAAPLIGEYHEHFPQSMDAQAAAQIAGSRVVAKLRSLGV